MSSSATMLQPYPLGFVARNKGGLFVDGDWIESKDLSDDGIKYLTSGNVGVGEFKDQGAGFISEETFWQLRCTEVLPGDILISRLNLPVGRACIVPDLGYRLVTCVDNVIVRPSDDFDRRFLVYVLSTPSHLEYTSNLARGATMQRVSRSVLGRIRLSLPDLPNQKQIADFLDRETTRIDALIEKKDRMVALLGDKARRDISSIFERLSHENRIWRLKHVLVAGLSYGANEPSDGDDPDDIRYIRITDIDADGNLRNDTFKSLPRERIRDYILEDQDILFARSGATVGKSFIYRKQMGEACYAGYLIRARVNTKIISPEFLKHFTSTDQYWNHILGTNIQATIQNVSAEKYANLAFPLPSLHIQREIAQKISINEKCHAATKLSLSTSINRLKEYRSALITAAVTGQIDVSVYERKGQPSAALDHIEAEAEA